MIKQLEQFYDPSDTSVETLPAVYLPPGSMGLIPVKLSPIEANTGLSDSWQVISYLVVDHEDITPYAIVNNVECDEILFLVQLDRHGRAVTSNNNGKTAVESTRINSIIPTHITVRGVEQNTNKTAKRNEVYASMLYDPKTRMIRVVNQSRTSFSSKLTIHSAEIINKIAPQQTIIDLLEAVMRGSFALYNTPVCQNTELTPLVNTAWRKTIMDVLQIYVQRIDGYTCLLYTSDAADDLTRGDL